VGCKPKLTLLFGPSRIGKTSIQDTLIDTYHWNGVDAGNPLKIAYANQEYLGAAYLDADTDLLEYVQLNQRYLLKRYENIRQQQNRRNGVGLAEFMRLAYPDIWVKLAKDIGYLNPAHPCVAALLNPTELGVYEKHYEVEAIVNLDCEGANYQIADNRYIGDLAFTHTIKYDLNTASNVTKYLGYFLSTHVIRYSNCNTYEIRASNKYPEGLECVELS
jgi:hypothetical protein